jgi:tellurite resistance protein TerC
MHQSELIFFGAFLLGILAILVFDLGVFNRKSHVIRFKEALAWSLVWIGLGLGFYVFLLFQGHLLHGLEDLKALEDIIRLHKHPINISGLELEEALRVYRSNLGLEYLTGYLIEYALSVDNVFVMIMIFYGFGVREKYFKWILFWGILGAIIMRFLFIFVSAALIHRFEWILYVFGGFLILTGYLMYRNRNKKDRIDPAHHPVVKFSRRFLSVFPRTVGHKLFIRNKAGKWFVTPLFIVLLVIEFTDVIFAIDSVPAIFSITKDPYIVFFSNIFAIIGLRSLFFLVMHVMNSFRFLKTGLSVLLIFIGGKMMVHDQLTAIGFKTVHSLIVVAAILAVSVLASLIWPGKKDSDYADPVNS